MAMTERSSVNVAVGLLSRRDHSREELKQKLRSRGFDVCQTEQALEKVDDWGYLNDERFAFSFVRYRSGRGLGPVRLRQELRERGVNANLIKAALEQEELDWFESCLQLYQRKFGEQPPHDFKERAKIQRYLAYRGFEMDQIRYALSGQ